MCAYYVYIKVDKGFTLWFDSVITKRQGRRERQTPPRARLRSQAQLQAASAVPKEATQRPHSPALL